MPRNPECNSQDQGGQPNRKKQKQTKDENQVEEAAAAGKLVLQVHDHEEQYLFVDQLIKDQVSLGASRIVKQCEPSRNWDERYFELKLLDSTTTDNKKEDDDNENRLASLSFVWWEDSTNANLMNFNQMSGDLADFCRHLWTAAGRPKDQYSDFGIEFGYSPHSTVEVHELISEACKLNGFAPKEITYLDVLHAPGSAKEKAYGKRLMNGLIDLLNEKSTLITHISDLIKLNVDDSPEQYGLRTVTDDGYYIRLPGGS